MTFNRRMKRSAVPVHDVEARVAAFANRMKAELPETHGCFVVTFDHADGGRLAWSSRRIGESDLVRLLNEMIGVFEQRAGQFGEPGWETATQIREAVSRVIEAHQLKPGEGAPDPSAVYERYQMARRGELTPEQTTHAFVAMATAAFIDLELHQRTHHLLREKPAGDA